MSSISDKNLGNFFVYGISEVILVVIGILIAVSLNNWNEKRKSEAELMNIYRVVKADLENDLAEIEDVQTFHDRTKPIFRQILGDSLSYDDFNQLAGPAVIILGYPEISFDKRGFSLLSEFRSNSELVQDTLMAEIVEFYTERLLEIDVDDKFRSRDFEDNYNYWKNTQPWWNKYITRTDFSGFARYATTGEDFKNRVANAYFLTYDVYLPELDIFKEQALKIIEDLNLKLNSN